MRDVSYDEGATSRVRAAIEDHSRLVAFVTARLDEDERTADGLFFAAKHPDRRPSFFACGGPAAEAYWEHFGPARAVRQVEAARAVLTAYEMSVRMLGEGLSRDKLMLVRAHAVIWEDHPDYDPAWRPS
jgi:hypothetical protein